MRTSSCLPLLLCLAVPGLAQAQRSVTLDQAVREALSRTPRLAIARADSAAAVGQLIGAREYPNPALAFGYSKSVPLWHVELEQSLEYPALRAARVRAARSHLLSATQLAAAERAAIRYDVEVAYVQAASAQAIQQLSERNARDAQDLLRITRARQAAGDASELDVRVAAVFAGQAQNAAYADSLAGITTVLMLQGLLGMQATNVEIAIADSLATLLPETT